MKIAIIGGGVVGGGVFEILQRHPSIEIVYLIVNDLDKPRDFPVPANCVVSSDINVVLNDDGVETVLEVMGGTDVAWEVIKTSLSRGRNVVTANKAIISKHMLEIDQILAAAEKRPFFLYEAAVCGGIPIINTFSRSMRGEIISSISGVMNGSTNWILDKMKKTGLAYKELLDEAKGLGYLEADPSADIFGWDARSKLCILVRIGFGLYLDESNVACAGIDQVRVADMEFATSRSCSVKLVAFAWEENGAVYAFVMPSIVPESSPLANLSGALNACCFEGKYSGTHILIGTGAGRYPTANSAVADILEIAKLREMHVSHGLEPFGSVNRGLRHNPDFKKAFYVRAPDTTVAECIVESFERHGIPALQENLVVRTDVCSYFSVRASLRDLPYEALLVML